MNDGLIYKLTWMLNDEKSPYKRTILQEAIDALSGSPWHDVEKELPKRGEDCLCHVQYGLDRDCNDVVISQLGRYKRFSIEQNVDGVKVLHWMPIPPLPKEDDASGEVQEVHLDGGEC